jgi:hypothetical protein
VSAPPQISVGRYVRDLPPGGAAQIDVMGRHGCIDARAGSTLVLLELGVQTIMPPRSRRDPGVLLTNSSIRLSYAQLRTALAAYLEAFASCARGRSARIALGTNTDGVADRTSRYYYGFADRGADWYDQVVAPMARLAEPLGLRVVGALDLEVGFAASVAQAEQWERSYLARDESAHLIDNGSLDACPPNYSPKIHRCGAVLDDAGRLKTWSIADYLRLISRLAPRRLEVLPQVYRPVGASKWAALDRWSGFRLTFAGVLTEWASCPDTATDGCFGTASLPPRKGWTAMRNALARARRDCLPPAVVDLRIDPLPVVPAASRRPPPRPRTKPPGKPAASRLARKPTVP